MNPLIVGGLFSAAEKLIDRFFPDPEKKAQAQLELIKMQQTGELAELAASTDLAKAQLAVNEKEAQNPSLFVSGWRPAVGWVCGLAFAYAAVIEPMGRFIASVAFDYKGAFPVIDTSLTMQILFGILGLGGLRTWEKQKKVAAR